MKPYLLLIIAIACSAGCGPSQEAVANGDDPIAALASTVASDRYGTAFWTQQMHDGTEIWTQALAYCEPAERSDYPNCKTVRSVQFIGVPDPVENPAASTEGFNP